MSQPMLLSPAEASEILGETSESFKQLNPPVDLGKPAASTRAPANPKGFLDVKGLLALLPISRRTLYCWMESGKIPSIQCGRRRLFYWPHVKKAVLAGER